MMWHRIAGLTVVILAFVIGGRLLAEEKKAAPSGDKRFDPTEFIGDKLGLNDRQREEIRKLHKEFEAKTDPLIEQLWTARHEECEQMKSVLTEAQRARLPEAIRAEVNNEFQKVAARLDLNDEQKAKVEKMREEFHKKFEALAEEKGANKGNRFRELRHEAMGAMCQVLRPEQRAKMPAIMHEEFRLWHDPAARQEHLKAMADQLGLTESQRAQEQKIQTENNRKIEQTAQELKQVFKEEHDALDKVLTPEQRTKWMELKKSWGLKERETNRK